MGVSSVWMKMVLLAGPGPATRWLLCCTVGLCRLPEADNGLVRGVSLKLLTFGAVQAVSRAVWLAVVLATAGRRSARHTIRAADDVDMAYRLWLLF